MKYIKVKYHLEGREWDSDITVDCGSPEMGVKINWSSHGNVSIADAKTFLKALQKAIKLAESNNEIHHS